MKLYTSKWSSSGKMLSTRFLNFFLQFLNLRSSERFWINFKCDFILTKWWGIWRSFEYLVRILHNYGEILLFLDAIRRFLTLTPCHNPRLKTINLIVYLQIWIQITVFQINLIFLTLKNSIQCGGFGIRIRMVIIILKYIFPRRFKFIVSVLIRIRNSRAFTHFIDQNIITCDKFLRYIILVDGHLGLVCVFSAIIGSIENDYF